MLSQLLAAATSNKIIDVVTALLSPAIASTLSYIVVQHYKKKYENDISDLHTSLTKHYFFSKIEHIKKYNIAICFTLENKGKEVVFKEILTKQMELFSCKLYDLVMDISNNPEKYQSGVLLETHVSTLNDIYNQLYNFYKTDDAYSTREKEVLDIIMHKYAKWNIDKYTRMEKIISDICNSMFYHNSSEKTAAILDAYIVALLDQLDSAQETLSKINGDLKGLKFKGTTI
jgi:uncharacterized metal-binding protein